MANDGAVSSVPSTLTVLPHVTTHAPNGSDPLPWSTIHGRGATGAKPAASAANVGYTYYDTTLLRLERSNGVTWDVNTPTAAAHAPGGVDPLPWTTITGRGSTASKPAAAATNAGYTYYDTTLQRLERSNGTTWDVMDGVMTVRDTQRNTVMAYSTAARVTVTADELLLQDAGLVGYVARTVNLTLDITVAGALGLDTGAEAASTWYHAWVIWDGTTVSGILSLSATAPTMPGTYTWKAYVGAMRNDAGSNFLRFVQRGKVVACAVVNALAAATPTAANTYQTLSLATQIPPNATTVAGYFGNINITTDRGMTVAADVNGVGECLAIGKVEGAVVYNYTQAAGFRVPLITSQQVAWKASSLTADFRMDITGWGYP